MTISVEIIDMIHALLKGSPAGMETSEILRGLRNRGIQISYLELEDWLHDEESVRQDEEGGFRLSHNFSATHLQKRRIIPESGESLDSVDDALVWPRLIDYYINCIKEEGKKVYSYRMHQNSSFVLLDQELVSTGERFASVARKDHPDFLKTISNRSVFYGYPLYLEWIDSRDSDFCDYKITPVFIIRLEVKEEPASAIFQFASQHVRLNPEILNKLRWKDRAHLEKVLDASDDQYSSFEERVALAASELSELGIVDERNPDNSDPDCIDPARIVHAKNLQTLKDKKPGVYNLCGLFSTGVDPYNKRLLGELEQVRELPVEQIKNSSLASLLRTKKQNLAETVTPPTDTCIFPGIGDSLLNAEQSTAVAESFNYPISVVTGPPGSGKSEVVASLVINAVLNDMSVLFASRNNKAVQVVQERLEALSGPHGLIRVGGSHDQQVIQLLDRMEALPMNHDGSFSSLWSVCQQLMDELDGFEKDIREWGELIDTSAMANECFDGMKRKHMRGVVDSEEKISRIDLTIVVEASRWLSAIHNDFKRGAKIPAWLKFKFGAKRGMELLGFLKDELEKAELDVECGFPEHMKETGPLLQGILGLVDLLEAFDRVQSANDAITNAGDLDDILEQTAEARSRLAKQVPVLLGKKVRENTAGPQQDDDDADDSLASFRENYKKLIKSKMDDEQRNVRASMQGQTFSSVLRRLPAWSVTNLSVGGRIPLQPGVFDLVIIDEASQCDIASCIPLLVRSKRAVVIGDPLQLSQISNISSVAEQQFLTEHQLNHPMFDHLIHSQKSIYDAARHVVPGRSYTFLSNHYRCGSDIIEFANSAHWYDERLEVFTDEGALKRPDWWKKGILWENVESGCAATGKKYMLPNEIDRAVALVKELEVRNYEGTVGIVCPFRDMTDRIRDAIFGGDISAHFLKGANLEVQTAHGFQGDARDVIIYVMGIHPDMPSGKVWFISDENRNLFNVALSRGKASFIVVGNRTAVSNLLHKKEPVRYLRDFVAYVDGLETKEDQPEDTGGDPEFSPEQLWEEKFYKDALKPADLNVISQYRVGPYRLDFGLLHQGRKLDIEVDGERWHKDAGGNRLEKDIDRNIYVKAQGWDVMRFWVYELKEDMGKCLKRIEKWMNSSE